MLIAKCNDDDIARINGDDIAKTDAKSNINAGLCLKGFSKGEMLVSSKISFPSEKEIADMLSGEENISNMFEEMANTPWGEIYPENPECNMLPGFERFFNLVSIARCFNNFVNYFFVYKASIDCRNLYQEAMLLRFIFLLAHDCLAEAFPVNDRHPNDGIILDYLQRLFNSKPGPSRIIYAYAYASVMMPYWSRPDSRFRDDSRSDRSA